MEGRRKSILIVDDDDGNRKLLAQLLGEAAYHVCLASDGIDALDEMQRAEFDAVITDLDMPRMNGLEFLVQCRTLWPETPVILVSAYASQARETVELRGAFAWVQKPYEACELLEVLESAVDAFAHRRREQPHPTTLPA